MGNYGPFYPKSMWYALLLQAAMGSAEIGTVADNIQGQASQDTAYVYAQIEPVCSVETSATEAVVDLSTRSPQTVSLVIYTCNSVEGFVRQISSENAGVLRRGSQSIVYFLAQTGDGPLAITRTQLASPVITAVPASAALTNGSGGIFQVDVPSLRRDLLAGEYRDTITVAITPN